MKFYCLSLLFVCSLVNAWSQSGHERLGEASFEGLSQQEKKFYGERLQALGYGADAEGMAAISAWPDSIRQESLASLAALLEIPLPKVFNEFAVRDSADWHYSNHYFPRDKAQTCRLQATGLLEQRLVDLEDAFAVSDDLRQQGFILAFMLHLIQDLHQPLHTLSRVDEHCQHDRGGNAFCLQLDGRGACQVNLHKMWDDGFGLWNQRLPIKTMPGRAERSLRLRDQVPSWAQESQELTDSIYRIKVGQQLDTMYMVRSRDIVKRRADLCLQRSLQVLKTLYRVKTGRE